MAERNTGPVKPPVLDLSARDTTAREEGAKPGAESAAKPNTESKPATPAARKADGLHWNTALAGIVGGAILGTALTYGLFVAGIIPRPAAEADPRVAALEKRLAEAADSSTASLNALQQRFVALQNDLNARLEAANEALKAAGDRPAAATPDLSGLTAQIDELRARIETLGANAGGATGEALTGDVNSLQQNLAALSGKLGALEEKVGTTDSKVAELSAEAQKTPELPAAQLPLLLSGLESAFDTGRPFAAELDGLRAVAPETAIPQSLTERAPQGLKRPDEITREFDAALPDILAATPQQPDAGWDQATIDWLRAIFAFRPAGEIAGNTPEAVASQLEAAISRRDYRNAVRLLAALPEAMRAPAEGVAADIAAHADADALLDSLRARALAPAGTTP
ncbi:COG4223 family protein [Paradevosia shaoguanensis]|uniref:COG4223 family protein n=1 Tax=Paradevosia shaoguanensis TaxID=1335043 RepID=UPI001932E88C|nr:hypothetical protein [Paradevosia shaoguanensis]